MAINGALRAGLFQKGKRHCLPLIPDYEALLGEQSSDQTPFLTLQGIEQGLLILQAQLCVPEQKQCISSLLQSDRFRKYFNNPECVEKKAYVKFQMAEGGCGKMDYSACKRNFCIFCRENNFWSCPNKFHHRVCTKCAPGTE